MKITKGMTIKVLLIGYRYTDKSIHAGSLGNALKKYYETNSRNTITINLTSVSYAVPFTNKECLKAIQYVKNIMPKGFDVNVHFCNPRTSHTGMGNVITSATTTNTIHEFGHALGLTHANLNLTGTSMGSRDPFDQMTMFAPYPSTNSVHRYQLGWFLDHELVDYIPGQTNYTIGMLKNFGDKTSVKVVLYKVTDSIKTRNFFVSYGAKKDKKKDTILTEYVTIHTIYGKNSSFLIGMYKVTADKLYTNVESGLSIKIGNKRDGTIDLVITTLVSQKLSAEQLCDDDDCEDCQLNDIADGKEDVDAN